MHQGKLSPGTLLQNTATKHVFVLCFLLYLTSNAIGQVQVNQLLIENMPDPIGIGVDHPRMTWIIDSKERGTLQTAYEVRVATSEESLQKSKGLVWNSGKVNSAQSVNINYNGKELQSEQPYYWQVRVWDNHGKVSSWSKVNQWQMGLLHTADWKAKWIEPGYKEDSAMRPNAIFRKEFSLKKKISSATLFITSHGLYEAYINGQRVGDAYLTPGWTSYNTRLQYQQYDVTHLLNKGNNAMGASIGSGWYRSALAWGYNINKYGKTLGLLSQIQITYDDGSSETIATDDSWKSSTGEVRYAEIYNGEIIDARLSKKNWTTSGYDDKDWNTVNIGNYGYDNLVSTQNELVKKHETFKPVKIFTTPKGEKVVDFGQNLVGWVSIKLNGNAGDSVKISHAEVLDKAGNFYTENLRAAKAEDIYVLNGEKDEIFEPHFTWHGFRYMRIEGYKGNLDASDLTAVTLYSAMPQTGKFYTSDSLINQLQHNIIWGQRGNFLDVPTDCPQRDERLGWTGDAQVFSRTASFNMNVNNFFEKWMKDVSADQFKDGRIPHVIPNVLGDEGGSAGWADVATIIPWNMYLAYGDTTILKTQYASMKAWVDYVKNVSKDNLWNSGSHFGDWLFYTMDNDVDGRAAVTDKYLIAQCFYAHSTQLLINAAKVLGNTKDEAFYSDLLTKIKAAFVREYLTPSGRLVSGTQTAYVLALNFDMLPDSLRESSANRLVQNIESYGNHITTGFLGTPYICEVLTKFGHSDVAYKLLLQRSYPSWLYPVGMGATTIWERWDGIKPDGSFENAGMNSFNHYAYGAIGDWMYRKMAGLDTYDDAPGYKHIKIQPHIGGGFSFASATLQTYYGDATSSWKLNNGVLQMDITIPANTTASVFVPGKNADLIKESGNKISNAKDIKVSGTEDNYVQLTVGSGTYHFEVPFNN